MKTLATDGNGNFQFLDELWDMPVGYRVATHEEVYQAGRDSKAAEILEALTRERFSRKDRTP